MKSLYFVRHGQTEWNRDARMQGRLNSDLTALGRSQAEAHAELLSQVRPGAIVASPMGRARQTAEIIREALRVPIQFDERIVEWDCGDWSGFLYDEVQERWAEEWGAFQADRYSYRPPGAENWPDMVGRVRPFLDELRAHCADRVAIVSHGLIGRVMVSQLLAMDRDSSLSLTQANDVVFELSIDGDRALAQTYVGGVGPYPGLTLIDS